MHANNHIYNDRDIFHSLFIPIKVNNKTNVTFQFQSAGLRPHLTRAKFPLRPWSSKKNARTPRSSRKSKKMWNGHAHATSAPRPWYVHVALVEYPLSSRCAYATCVRRLKGSQYVLATSVQIETRCSYVYTASATSCKLTHFFHSVSRSQTAKNSHIVDAQ